MARAGVRAGGARRVTVRRLPPREVTGLCGIRIFAPARPNRVLAADECALTTYGILPGTIGAGVLTMPVIVTAFWGPGDRIPPFVAGAGALRMNLVGGVILKNC